VSRNKIVKPVSFNITKQDDAKMLDHVKRRNFSGYIKKLIWQDIKSQEEKNAENEPLLKPSEVLTTAQRLQQAKAKLAGKDAN
jgi:hypothetical protein